MNTMLLAAGLATSMLALHNPQPAEEVTFFLGDSRTVGIENVAEEYIGSEQYICEVGKGYQYLTNTAWPEFEAALDEYSEDTQITVILNFGVNDLYNEKKYAEFINSEIQDLPDNVHVHWASVNPTSGEYSDMRNDIQVFNANLCQDLNKSIRWIDSYSYLETIGYQSSDGLHYSAKTNCMIHDYWLANRSLS